LPNFALNNSIHPGLPRVDNIFDGEVPTAGTFAARGPYSQQPNAYGCGPSEGQLAPFDNIFGLDNQDFGVHSGGNEDYQTGDLHPGMDGNWRATLPPTQLYQTGGNPNSTGANQYASHNQNPTGNSARSYNAGPPHHPQLPRALAGVSMGALHPAELLRSPRRQPSQHLPSAPRASRPSNGISPPLGKPAARTNKSRSPSRASQPTTRPSAASNQSATQISQPNSATTGPLRPFTAEDFRGIRIGGGTYEKDGGWNKLTRVNHYDYFLRYHGRPALPNAPPTLSNFKQRSLIIDNLTPTDEKLLDDFIDAAKYWASTGQPNRPSAAKAPANIEGEGEDENKNVADTANQPGQHQGTQLKKRARSQQDDDVNEFPTTQAIRPQKRARKNPSPAKNLQNKRAESRRPMENPGGYGTFADIAAADRWLASQDQPTILEAATRYFANQGFLRIAIAGTGEVDLSGVEYPVEGHASQSPFQGNGQPSSAASMAGCGAFNGNFHWHTGAVAPSQAGYNTYSPAVDSSTAGAGSSGSRPATLGKRKASTDSEEQGHDTRLAGPRTKKVRTSNEGTANLQNDTQAVRRRKQKTQSKGRKSLQMGSMPTEVHSEAQYHPSLPVEHSSFGIMGNGSPNFGGQDMPYDYGNLFPNTGLGDNGNGYSPSPYPLIATDQFHSSKSLEGTSLFNTEAYTDLIFDEDPVDDGHYDGGLQFEIDCRSSGLAHETHENDGGFQPNSQNVESRPEFEKDPAGTFLNEDFDFESFPDDPSE
jgi:hypothetical protein